MARVCLLEPKPDNLDFQYAPTGLLSIAATLEAAGHNVSIHVGMDTPPCDFLGISAVMHRYPDAIRAAIGINARVKVIGGPYVTTNPSAVKSPVLDYGIVGDGELAMLSLVSGVDRRQIPGLVYKESDCIFVNPPRRVLSKDMKTPAYHLLDVTGKSVNVCKAKEWSFDGIMWNRNGGSRLESNRVDTAICRLLKKGISRVVVTDESFCGGWDRTKMIVRSLDKVGAWSCRTNVEDALSSKLDQRLAGSGCDHVELFIGTASERLAAEHNLPGPGKAMSVIGPLSKFGLTLNVVLGLPGETVESLDETARWLRSVGLPVRAETFIPYPGTAAWENKYDHFGFEVTGTGFRDFYADDTAEIHSLPWSSAAISARDFLQIRNGLIKEFNRGW